MADSLNYLLFGGEHDYCLPGMDGYVDHYDDIEQAVNVAEMSQFDWAHIVKCELPQLTIVNVGRWDRGSKRMIWQANYNPVTHHEAMLKTCCVVLRAGLVLLADIPYSELREQIKNTASGLYWEIQSNVTLKPEAHGVAVYLIRQVLTRIIETLQRTPMIGKQAQTRAKWTQGASNLLKETEALTFASDRLENAS